MLANGRVLGVGAHEVRLVRCRMSLGVLDHVVDRRPLGQKDELAGDGVHRLETRSSATSLLEVEIRLQLLELDREVHLVLQHDVAEQIVPQVRRIANALQVKRQVVVQFQVDIADRLRLHSSAELVVQSLLVVSGAHQQAAVVGDVRVTAVQHPDRFWQLSIRLVTAEHLRHTEDARDVLRILRHSRLK